MATLYILQNQHGYFLKKSTPNNLKEWTDGREPQVLFRTIHKDEALNMLVETNSQAVDLRISIKEYPSNPKNHPFIPTEELPPPLVQEIESNNTDDDCQQEPLDMTPDNSEAETLAISR
jgi:hypothetical protein